MHFNGQFVPVNTVTISRNYTGAVGRWPISANCEMLCLAVHIVVQRLTTYNQAFISAAYFVTTSVCTNVYLFQTEHYFAIWYVEQFYN